MDEVRWSALLRERYSVVHVHWPERMIDGSSVVRRLGMVGAARGRQAAWLADRLDDPQPRISRVAAELVSSLVLARVHATGGRCARDDSGRSVRGPGQVPRTPARSGLRSTPRPLSRPVPSTGPTCGRPRGPRADRGHERHAQPRDVSALQGCLEAPACVRGVAGRSVCPDHRGGSPRPLPRPAVARGRSPRSASASARSLRRRPHDDAALRRRRRGRTALPRHLELGGGHAGALTPATRHRTEQGSLPRAAGPSRHHLGSHLRRAVRPRCPHPGLPRARASAR